MCKLIHVCPSVVFDQLLTQVQTFDNFIGPTVDSIKLLTPLEYDLLCCTFIVLMLMKTIMYYLQSASSSISADLRSKS